MSCGDTSSFIAGKLDAIDKHILDADALDEKDSKFNNQYEYLLNKFKTDIDVFQEAPHLLDPRLPGIVKRLVDCVIRYAETSERKLDLSFAMAYLVTKVRGFKVVIRHLPHEVADMLFVMKMLSHQDASDCRNWETKYMLLLWLSVLCLIPLDMRRFDADDATTTLSRRYV